jgi:hypothetical protein
MLGGIGAVVTAISFHRENINCCTRAVQPKKLEEFFSEQGVAYENV